MPDYIRIGCFDIEYDPQTNTVSSIEVTMFNSNGISPNTDMDLAGDIIHITTDKAEKIPFSNNEDRYGHVGIIAHYEASTPITLEKIYSILNYQQEEIAQTAMIVLTQWYGAYNASTSLPSILNAISIFCNEAKEQAALRVPDEPSHRQPISTKRRKDNPSEPGEITNQEILAFLSILPEPSTHAGNQQTEGTIARRRGAIFDLSISCP